MELSFLDIIYTCSHHPSKFWCISSVTQLCLPLCGHAAPHGPQHTRPPCLPPTPRVYPNSCPLSRWCHLTSSSFVVPFSSCLQSFKWVFSNESALRIRWPKYWSFSFNISPSNEHSGLISFRMYWLDHLAVQGTLKSLLQHYSSKASILRHSAFFIVQLSYPYMTTRKTIALTRQTFVGKVMSLLFNMLSRLVLVVQTVKRLPVMRETQVQSLGWEDPLEKEMATHSSILAWRILWIEEPGRLQSTGLQRVGHDWATSLCFC